MEFTRKEFLAVARGINLSRPPDQMPDGFWPYLKNVYSPIEGTLSSREGMTEINSSAIGASIHTIRRLNYYLDGTFRRFLGAGTQLYADDVAHSTFVSIATGFNGKPLTSVIMRPPQSPSGWVYWGNGQKLVRTDINSAVENIGIAPPNQAAVAQVASVDYTVIDNGEDETLWVQGGTAAAPSGQSRINDTIRAIVYDDGTDGWCIIAPDTWTQDFQPGLLLTIDGTEEVFVESVASDFGLTTVAGIVYNGTLATVQLTDTSYNLEVNQMIVFGLGTGTEEYARVISVTSGSNGVPSFTCRTTIPHFAGDTVQGVQSFRTEVTGTYTGSETLTSDDVQTTVTTGIGYITKTITLDLSQIGGVPISGDTELHISIKLDKPQNLIEGRVLLDVDAVLNDFTQNYFYKNFDANALAAAAVSDITTFSAQQTIIQQTQVGSYFEPTPTYNPGVNYEYKLRQLDRNDDLPYLSDSRGPDYEDPIGVSTPVNPTTATGTSQWSELRFHVKDLIQIGSDKTRTLRDVKAVRVQLEVTDDVIMDFDSFWIGGVGGVDSLIDVGRGAPINYRYVYYNSRTGARSNPSPVMRNPIDARKQAVLGTVTAATDPQVDQIEIYRTGGSLVGDPLTGNNPWYYVMSVPNATAAFVDTYQDSLVIRNRQLDFDNFQPFLDTDIPKSGTCDVVGTEVTRLTGDLFNTNWPEGTLININNVPYTLYGSPLDDSHLSLSQSADNLTNVEWFIVAPRLMGRPLPAIFGPLSGAQFDPVMLACGSDYQPGTLFWTRPGNPDSHSAYNQLEVSDPSERLVNGVVYRNQGYVWSTEDMYVLTPTIFNAQLKFISQKISGGVGLISRSALTDGDVIYFVSKDGIYATNGGPCQSITDRDLYPIFPHSGVAGTTTNGIVPPDYTRADEFQLDFGQGKLYFTYPNTDGDRACLMYDTRTQGWFPFSFTPTIDDVYFEEGTPNLLLGGSDGTLFISGAADDNGTAIEYQVDTPWFNAGDPRAQKQWGDGNLDFRGENVAFAVVADNGVNVIGSGTLDQAIRGLQVVDFTQGLHVNIGHELSGEAPFQLFAYDFSYVPKPELTKLRATDWDNLGTIHNKYIQGVRIHADTGNVVKTVKLFADNADTGIELDIQANGEQVLPFSWEPFIAHLVKLVPDDTDDWRKFEYEFVYDLVPERTEIWKCDTTSLEFPEYGHCYYVYVTLNSTAEVTLTVTVDGEEFEYTIPSTGGNISKVRVPLEAVKGKLFQFALESEAPFRLYRNQSVVWTKPWNSPNPYDWKLPFGDESALTGARI